MKATSSGMHQRAILPRMKSSMSLLPALWPCLSLTISRGRSSHFGCRMPMTAASATFGWLTARFSELDRGDPLAARLDHVLGAVGDLHVAVRIDRGDIARVEIALRVEHVGPVSLK